jgi:hypothetical protein
MADPTQTIQYQTGFAPEIAPAAQKLVGKAEAWTDFTQHPYMQYQGDQVAQFSPMQKQSYENAANMQATPQLGQATTGLNTAMGRALNTQYNYNPYQAQQVGAQNLQNYQMGPAQQVSAQNLQNYQMQGPQQVGTQDFRNQGTAQSFMNPYTQNVMDVQSQAARRAAGMAGAQQQAQATQAGAFGGGRDAIMRAQNNANLQQNLAGIQSTGLNNAFQQAQNQFNTQNQAALQAQMANQQAGLTTGAQNLAANLGVQQLGAGQNLQAQLANQQAGLTTGAQNLAANLGVQQLGSGQNLQAQIANQAAGLNAAQLNAQQGQFGAGLGLQGLQTGITGANALAGVGQNQYQQNMGINQLQNQYGGQQQQQAQNVLNTQYQNWQNAQNYPYQQMNFMSNILRGLPMTQQGSQMYQAPPSFGSQVAGLGLAGASMFGGGKAKGGAIKQGAGLADLALARMGA